MTARKKELVQMDDFISLGGMELAKQTPAQRGIQAAEDPKGNKNPKYPKSDKRQKEPKEPKEPETVMNVIFDFYRNRALTPSAQEQEILLEL